MRLKPAGHSPDLFQAVIRGGPHDGHVHLFPYAVHPLTGIRVQPPELGVPAEEGRPDGVLRLAAVTDIVGRPVYVYTDLEGNLL